MPAGCDLGRLEPRRQNGRSDSLYPASFSSFLVGRVAALAFVLTGCVREPEPEGVQSSYDRFTGANEVSVQFEVAAGDVGPLQTASLGMRLSAPTWGGIPARIGVTFTSVVSSSAGWQYLHCHSLDFLADGRPFHVDTQHDGRVGAPLLEFVSGYVPPHVVAALATARRAEGRLCNTEFQIIPRNQRMIRQFMAQFGPSEAPSAPPASAPIPAPLTPAGAPQQPLSNPASQTATASAELAPTEEGPPPVPSRESVAAAMSAVAPSVRRCAGGRGGVVEFRVVFLGSGDAETAAVTSGPFSAGDEGECMVRAARQARVPPFTSPRLEVTFPILIR